MRSLPVTCLGLFLLTLLGPNQASGGEEVHVQKPVKVGVLPVRSFQRTHHDLWGEVPATSSGTDPLDTLLKQLIEREPSIQLTLPEELRQRLTDSAEYKERVNLGRERLKLGVELYKELRVDEAIPHLVRANELLLASFVDLTEPEVLAALSFTLAQCLMEKGRADEAHIALKEMFFRMPDRRFKKGFYSLDVEQALERAWIDFVATYVRQNPVGSVKRIKQLMAALDIDQLVYAFIDPSMTGDVRQLTVLVYERRLANVAYRSSLDLTDSANVERELDRLMSRWTTCLPVEGFTKPKKKKVKKERFYVDTAFAYSRFLSDDVTRQGFNHFGLAVSGEWRIKGNIGIFLQFHVQTTTVDNDRDLFSPYTTVRAQTGLSYSVRRSWWRLYVRAGVEAHFFGDFKTTTNPECKFFGGQECDGQVEDFQRDIVVGPTTTLGASFFLSNRLYLTVRAVATFFAFPFDKISEINYPLGGEVGIGYAF